MTQFMNMTDRWTDRWTDTNYWREQFQTISEDVSVRNVLMHSAHQRFHDDALYKLTFTYLLTYRMTAQAMLMHGIAWQNGNNNIKSSGKTTYFKTNQRTTMSVQKGFLKQPSFRGCV